jgi:hypothetical protein
MNITITQQDIDGAIPRNAWHCAVARAFQRAERDSGISVGAVTAGPAGNLRKWRLTAPLLEYIRDFDEGRPVYPVTFLNIEPPSPEKQLRDVLGRYMA